MMPEEKKKPKVPFWEASPHTGRKPHYTDPQLMRSDALEYMQWVEDNPFIEVKPMIVAGEVEMVEVPRRRPSTLTGLQIFIGMSYDSWREYRQKPIFSEVIKEVESWIYDSKFTGAASGFFKENIIARDLGLADKARVDASMDHTINVIDNYGDTDTE